jgi:hypothetical protein
MFIKGSISAQGIGRGSKGEILFLLVGGVQVSMWNFKMQNSDGGERGRERRLLSFLLP